MLVTLTIGQAPRSDITPILERYISAEKVIHLGVLDGLSHADIIVRFSPVPGKPELISRLRDGFVVRLDKQAVQHALQVRLAEIKQMGATCVLLLCTGRFEGLTLAKNWLVEPDHLVPAAISALIGDRQVGVVVPLESQTMTEVEKFSILSLPPIMVAASPYSSGADALVRACKKLREQGCEAILLDCMGFVEAHRNIAREASGLPVILSNAMVAKMFSELVL